MAACPCVYVSGELVGEILRNLRAPELEQWQELSIPTARVGDDGVLSVTLEETKPEVTHLDGVYLEVDGERVGRESCLHTPAAWCEVDGDRHVLSPGHSLELRFRVGNARNLMLWARGYYVPLTQSHVTVSPQQ